VVTTKASPGGCTSIHQSASLDIVCDLGTSCDALKGAVAILDYRLRHPVLARPPELSELGRRPADRISDVRVLGWVEQISERLPGGGEG
jgi:hypothetical protein